MKILVDENIPLLPEALASCGEVYTFAGRSLRREDLTDIQALFVRSVTKINDSLLEGTAVRFVGTATAGMDHIDLASLEKRGIVFAAAGGSNASAVAEYVLYSVLRWTEKKESVQGKQIGIIGFGAVGKRVAELAHQLSLTVAINDPPLREKGYGFPSSYHYMELPDLLAESHIITNHVPLEFTGKYPTYQLLGKAELERIQRDSLFVHSSRGGVVDESALLPLLQNGHLTGALDVWEHEPAIRPELAQACLLCTPHIAGYSWEGKLRGSLIMADAFATWSHCVSDLALIADHLRFSPNDDSTNTNLLSLLETNRCFAMDDQNLRATFRLEPVERAAAFDVLRKDYPQRHEVLFL